MGSYFSTLSNPSEKALLIKKLKATELLPTRDGVGGAPERITEEDGWTPLHFACAMGGMEKNREFSSKAVGLLLSVGAPITTTDDLERSPVHIASMYGLLENVKLLLASPAAKDLDLLVGTDRNGWTPLHTAAAFRWSTVAEYLMSSEAGKKRVGVGVGVGSRRGRRRWRPARP